MHKGMFDSPTRIEFDVAPGAHGLNVPNLSEFGAEKEWISGGHFKVDSVEQGKVTNRLGGQLPATIVHLTQVPSDQEKRTRRYGKPAALVKGSNASFNKTGPLVKVPWLTTDQPQLELPAFSELRVSEKPDKTAVSGKADKRYSEDQPRDADGRFGSGGDSATPPAANGGSSEAPQPSYTTAVPFVSQGHDDYIDKFDTGGSKDIDYSKIQSDPVSGKAIAELYNAAPLDDPAAHAAYDQLAKETDQQYEYLTKTMGVTVEVTDKDPYQNVKDMAEDLRDNHHLAVLSTAITGGHPYFSNEQNDKFRAVHDAFGHAGTGRGFDRNGEAAAWVSHMQMYSPEAGKALTTETRGQNSSMIYGDHSQPLNKSVNPYDEGGFPPQKVMLLPDEYTSRETRGKSVSAQASADADNLYSTGRSHHTSQGRHFPPTEARHVVNASDIRARLFRYSDDQPRNPDGTFAGGDSKDSGSGGKSAGSGPNPIGTPTGPGGHLTAQDTAKLVGVMMNGGKITIPSESLPIVLGSMRSGIEPVNLENAHITGPGNENLFDHTSLTADQTKELSQSLWPDKDPPLESLPREAMPVIPSDAETTQKFADYLGGQGFKAEFTTLDPRQLTATQDQLNGVKVSQILEVMKTDPGKIASQAIVVDRNGAVLDGHHRWAAEAAYAVSHPDFQVPVLRVDTDIATLLTAGEKFDQEQGIEHKPFGATENKSARRRAELRKVLSDGNFKEFTPPPDGETPPDPSKPYLWFDGQWILLATDDGDGVPRKIEFKPPTNSSDARSRLLRYSDEQPRDPDGRFAGGGESPKADAAEGGTYGTFSRQDADKNAERLAQLSSSMVDGMYAAELSKIHSDTTIRNGDTGIQLKALTAERIAGRMGTQLDDKHAQSGYVVLSGPTQAMVSRPGQDLHASDILNGDFYLVRGDSGSVSVNPIDYPQMGKYQKDTVAWMNRNGGVITVGMQDESAHAMSSANSPSAQPSWQSTKSDHDLNQPDMARGDTPEAAQMLREAAVAGLVHQWASTSNDSNTKSLAIQESAKQEFGLSGSASWQPKDGPMIYQDAQKSVDSEIKQNGDYYRAFLRAQYDETQQQLKDAGITGLDVFRGQDGVDKTEKAIGNYEIGAKDISVATRPLGSWSTDKGQARTFGKYAGDESVVYSAHVPADRIFSTPSSGLGCYGENEVVLLGGKDTMFVEPARSISEHGAIHKWDSAA